MTLMLYFAGRLVRNFLLALAVSAALLFIIDSLESSKMIMGSGVPVAVVAELFWAKLKIMIFQIAPLALLLAVAITIGSMELKSELTAVQAGGINPAFFVAWSAGFSLAVAGGMFAMEELVVPGSSRAVDEITTTKLGRYTSTWTYFYRERNWFRGPSGNLFKISSVDHGNGTLDGVLMLSLDGEGRISRRVEAKSAAFSAGRWELKDAVFMEFPESGPMRRTEKAAASLDIPERISDFRIMKGRPQQMRYAELSGLIAYRKAMGIEVRRYLFELFAKIAYPLSALFVALAGAACIFMFRGGVSILRYVVYATALVFVYWIFHSFGASASESGLLPPLVGAWMPNMALLLAAAGAYMKRAV